MGLYRYNIRGYDDSPKPANSPSSGNSPGGGNSPGTGNSPSTGNTPNSVIYSSFQVNASMYGIIVLALFPFGAFFACGYLVARKRFSYAQAATKETVMTPATHTSV